ncbi:tripartite motif-containing protein 44 [Pimephales promelas]|uniref:tripartite motif-containing protein 44 n=1 Tax=Pimephales promelas TaxID=90988 RepID=UPI00195598E3|nr:tripartite motif-containing protein 44 [Pimephales promelas]
MDASGGNRICLKEEDLPQMDGTCDACEPDEPQPAVWVCSRCRFAFCGSHADSHSLSTGHPLQAYGTPEPQPEPDRAAQGAAAPHELQSHSGAGKRETVTVERLKCKEHDQEGSLYCKQDQRVICVVCAVQGEHREHEIITLREAYLWQKSREGIDLLERTQEISDRIKNKWISPDMGADELERFVNDQFDELHRLVRLEEWRVLHLVDLKEAFLTAQAAEKISEISVHTEKLQEEMDSITQQLSDLDQMEQDGVAPMSLAPLLANAPAPAPEALLEPRPLIPDLRLRAANHRRDVEGPSGDEERGDAYIGNTP